MSVEKEDKFLTCRDCAEEFIFTAREQEFYAQKGFENEPTRCSSCRALRKRSNNNQGNAMNMGNYASPNSIYYQGNGGGYGNGGGNQRGNYNNGGGYGNGGGNQRGNYNNGGGYGNGGGNQRGNYNNGGGYGGGGQRSFNYTGNNNQRGNYNNGGGYGGNQRGNYNNGGGYGNGGGYNNGGGYGGNQRGNYNNGGGYGNGGGYNNGGGYGNGGGYSQPVERVQYPIVCANCGVKTEVPFVPREGVPVFCRVCYNNQKPNRN